MTNITVPELGESVVEARVAKWLKKEGDRVAIGEPLVELETEKIDLEVSADRPGVLTSIKHQRRRRREGRRSAGGARVRRQLTRTDAPAAPVAPTQPHLSHLTHLSHLPHPTCAPRRPRATSRASRA